jgi:hypothetical protein
LEKEFVMSAQLRSASRSHGIAGILAGVLFGIALTSSKLPGGNTTPGDFTAWFGTRSHQIGGIVLSYLLAAVALTFAWFFVGLERRVRSASGLSSSRLQLAGLTGAVVVAGLLVAAGAAFGMAGPLALEHGAKAGEATVALGWLVLGLLVISMLAAGVTITALSLDGRQYAALPTWNARVAYVCAILLVVGSVVGAPMMAFAIWLVATGIVLARPGVAAVPSLVRQPHVGRT